jgi:hypothetical protein
MVSRRGLITGLAAGLISPSLPVACASPGRPYWRARTYTYTGLAMEQFPQYWDLLDEMRREGGKVELDPCNDVLRVTFD